MKTSLAQKMGCETFDRAAYNKASNVLLWVGVVLWLVMLAVN